MNIIVNPEPQACLNPLRLDEYETLERGMLAGGRRDAPVVWLGLETFGGGWAAAGTGRGVTGGAEWQRVVSPSL